MLKKLLKEINNMLISIITLLLLGAIIFGALVFFTRMLCQSVIRMMVIAMKQVKQGDNLVTTNSRIIVQSSKKVWVNQVDDILKRSKF